ncbi:MAG: Cytosine-specific methyltransferase [Parcubacteria group bacterium GW2011_GWF2_38_76]|nr:MAG: Cytosine-specific methyltransferase [Parcubacteria group bacterium GW2011_GWF2_38_76]HBM46135.1 DNA (cytosine-5-)-methyltransferase [Patescibacteria group bacterium]
MKIISLFAGAGGMDLGFLKAGHKIIWVNDNDPDSCLTYEKNFNHKPVCRDIEDVLSSEIPNGDVVIGGFPCQGFSIANPYRNTEDGRNKLYLELLRVIRDKKPKYFIAENVAGICSIGGYENNEDKKNHTGRVFKTILQELKNAIPNGYNVEFKILNTADFGVPQQRRRVIILGTRMDIKKKLSHPEPTHSKTGDKNLPKWKTVKDAIFDLPITPNDKIPNHIGTKHKVKINGHIGNRATKWNEPSPTIVGRGGGTGGPVIIPHPSLKRRMTPRETARIQCFPDDFIFEGSISSQYRQIGNAVPYLLAYHIAKNIPKN